MAILEERVEPDSIVCTDISRAYNALVQATFTLTGSTIQAYFPNRDTVLMG